MNQNETTNSTVFLNGEQPKQMMTVLAEKAQNLRWKLEEANKAGDGKAFEKLAKELKATEKQMKQVAKSSFDLKKVLDDLSGASIPDLAKAKKELDKQLRSPTIVRNSKEWKELQEQLKAVKSEMSAVNDESRIGETRLSKITSRLGITIGVVALATAAWSLLSNAISKIFEFSKAVSELSALTGATGKDLDFLKSKAKELGAEFGKSSTEIITAMKLVGSAKPELLSNVVALSDVTKSVLTLSKATGMDLAQATDDVTTIMNQFGLSASEADRTVNVLAAGSKFGAKEVDYLGDSISKVGTVAKSAHLTLEQTTAVMELFGEKGVKAETAGNGFKKVLVELQSDTKNYTNGLFDLNKAIDNNKRISGDNIALQKKFGSEFFNIAQILLQNKSRFDELTKQVTGTTVAEEQMLIATDNLSGDVDKMSSSWDAFILSLEDGKGPIANASRWLIQLGKSAIDALSSLTKSSDQKEADLITLNVNNRIKSLKEEIALSKDKVKVIDETIAAERNIYIKNQKEIKKLKDEMVENDKKNFLMHSTQLDSTNKKEIESLQKNVNRSIAFVNAAARLKKSILETPEATDEKGTDLSGKGDKTAVQKKRIDEALKALEIKSLKDIAIIKKKYIDGDIKTEYDYNQALLAQQDAYDKIRKDKLNELLDVTQKGHITDKKLRLDLANQIAEIDKRSLDRQIDQNNKIKKILLEADPIRSENESYNNRLRELGLFGVEREAMTADQLETLRILEEQHNATLRKLSTKDAISQLKQLERDQEDAERVAANNRESGVYDEQRYKNKLISIEIEFLKKKLEIQGLSADEIDKLSKSLTEKLVSNAEKSAQNLTNFKEKYGIDELDVFKKRKELELQILQEYLDKGILSEKDAAKVRAVLASEEFKARTKDFAEIAGGIADVSGVFSNALQGFQSAEEKSIETKYQKQIDAAQKAGKDTTKIEEEKNKELARVRAENADANFALQVAQIISSTAVAAINAYSAMASIPFVGPVLGGIAAGAAVAYGASQIAVAESAREAAKEGYSDGGFTKPGDKYEPAGIVHAGEFVANQDAVRSTPMRKVFNLIDHAQRTNTVARITNEDIARVVGVRKGFSDGGYTSAMQVAGGGSGSGISKEQLAWAIQMAMQENNAVNAALLAQLQNGIKADVLVSGKNGIAEATKMYNQLISNAKG